MKTKFSLSLIPDGPKVYFPNFVFTMVRSGRERKPNTHVFRVPIMLNKLDIKNYLEKIYSVRVKKIETTTFLPRTSRAGKRYIPTRKNAVIEVYPEIQAGKEIAFKYPPVPDREKLKFPLDLSMNYPIIRKK